MRSPYFNRSEELLHFHEWLEHFAPAYSDPALERDQVLSHLPMLENQVSKLNYYQNQLLKQAELFLVVEDLKSDSPELHFRKLETFDALGLDSHYQSLYKKSLRELETAKMLDPELPDLLARLLRLNLAHTEGFKRDISPELQAASDALDIAYLIRRSRFSLAMETYARVFNARYKYQIDLELLLQALESNRPAHPLLEIYFHALRLIKDTTNSTSYQALKQILKDFKDRLPEDDLRDLYRHLINYCTRQINVLDDSSFHREVLDINKYLLAEGLLLEEGVLAPWRYSNIVTAGLKAGSTDWTFDFIKKQKDFLPEAYQENLYKYNLGHYYFATNQLDKAQTILNQVELNDLLLSISTRNLLAKVYFLQGETELLLQFLENYRIYIYRQESISDPIREKVKNFIAYLRKIADPRPPFKEYLRELAEELEAEEAVLEKNWLKEVVSPSL